MLIRYLGRVLTAEVIRPGMTAGSQVLLIGRRSASYLGFAQWELVTATSRNGGSR